MKNKTKILILSIIVISVAINILLGFYLDQANQAIGKSKYRKRSPIVETTQAQKVEPVQIENKSDFLYIKGEIIEINWPMSNYDKKPNIPDYLYSGYISLIVSQSGEKFYIWNEGKIVNQKFACWFLSANLGPFQRRDTKEYYNLIFAI